MNILILGGTSEASELVELLPQYPDIKATLSLAGRTKSPVLPQINHRIGGFGGVAGLVSYIQDQKITAIVCATHPFARRMPFNAQEAAKIAGVPIIHLLRKPWLPQASDNWIEVDSHKDAINHLSLKTQAIILNIFLTVGRLELAEYVNTPQYSYLIRSIDALSAKPIENAQYITARPPFSIENERKIMQKYKIDFLITKNSGGTATEAKLTAARELKIPVILINRPIRPEGLHVEVASDAIKWLVSLK